MLLAIDAGNTNSSFGVSDGDKWLGVWRKATRWDETEDELGAWLHSLFSSAGITSEVDGMVVASVVPQLDAALRRLGERWFGVPPVFVEGQEALGIQVRYDPPAAVGADRIANALGALAKHSPPVIVVDFGTATTLDAVSAAGAYVGGAIFPGPQVSAQALASRTAKLSQVDLIPPAKAIGGNTSESLRSGLVIGYAGAIEALIARFRDELGGDPMVLATGGYAELYAGVCPSIQACEPNLTLDGLVVAYQRLSRT